MAIGTSSGGYYENEFDMASDLFKPPSHQITPPTDLNTLWDTLSKETPLDANGTPITPKEPVGKGSDSGEFQVASATTKDGTKALNFPVVMGEGDDGGNYIKFNYNDYREGRSHIQEDLMNPNIKPKLGSPELTPSEAETIPGRRITETDTPFKVADVTTLRIPANDNKNLQIPSDPYTDAMINNQWNSMVKRGSQPQLKIIPGGKSSDSDEFKIAGDVIPLSISPRPTAGPSATSVKDQIKRIQNADDVSNIRVIKLPK